MKSSGKDEYGNNIWVKDSKYDNFIINKYNEYKEKILKLRKNR